jgi:4-hydroxy-3-methylbut-2-enyl diphosphate reductase
VNPAAGRVLLAAPRGCCAGVDRAIAAVEKALEVFGPPVYVRRHVVHNEHVVAALQRRGAIFVAELGEVPPAAVVVLAAHGVAPAVRREARQRGLRTLDATCPLVAKVHNEVTRFVQADYDILLIGQPGHDEVIGTCGEAPDRIQVVTGPDEVGRVVVRDPSRVVWLSQTTLSVDETAATVACLRRRFPLLTDPPSDDICYAAQNRQNAVKQIARQADLVLVVGSATSHNSTQLVRVALAAGAAAAHLVDAADGINPDWLAQVRTVGLAAGASAPEILVRGVLDRLSALGFTDVIEVRIAVEEKVFALPRELLRPATPPAIAEPWPGPRRQSDGPIHPRAAAGQPSAQPTRAPAGQGGQIGPAAPVA